MSLYRAVPGKLRGRRSFFITAIVLLTECCKITQLFFEWGPQMLQITAGNVSNTDFHN
jgi:hypothetical protein